MHTSGSHMNWESGYISHLGNLLDPICPEPASCSFRSGPRWKEFDLSISSLDSVVLELYLQCDLSTFGSTKGCVCFKTRKYSVCK